MAEILQLVSIVRRLYQPDAVPLAQLQLESCQQVLREQYKFTGSMVLPGQMFVTGGEFQPADVKASLPIPSVLFAPNVVEIQVAGPTRAAQEMHSRINKVIETISGKDIAALEYARSVQTIAVARLDVPFDALLSDRLNHFVEDAAFPAFGLTDADHVVQFSNLQWTVNYNAGTTDYRYEPKIFTIAPRAGSRTADRIYFTQSPTDSEVHVGLLNELEKRMK